MMTQTNSTRLVVTAVASGYSFRRETLNTTGYWNVISQGFYETFPMHLIAKASDRVTIHVKH